MVLQTTIAIHYPPPTLNPTAQEFTPTNHIPFPFAVAVGVPFPYPHFAVAPPPHLSTLPTRSLLLTPLPPTPQSNFRKDLETFGDVRAVQTESLRHGILTVDYFDLRHAQAAFSAIRTHHVHCVSFFNQLSHPKIFAAPPPPPGLVAGVPLWAHYVLSDAENQGTLVVFNLDDDVSLNHLRRVFEPFGDIKEVRETGGKKKSERFVEYFDIRDAAKALKQMNGKEINGKSVVIEFSKPSGYGGRKFFRPTNPNPNPNPNPNVSSNKPFHLKFNNNYNNNDPHGLLRRRFGPPPPSPRPQICDKGRAPLRGCWNGNERNMVRRQSSERGWNWKGREGGKKDETLRFVIKEDAIVHSEYRTTLMIKNIPNKYSQKLLLKMLDNHCIECNEQIGDGDDQPLSSYDFVYLPIDFKNKCNVGYGFVNMTSPEATLRLYKAFHHQPWEVFNSRKICQLTYARIQGLEALKDHFKNSKFPCEMEHYLPVVFSPPRDGKQLTEPIPVVGNMLRMTTALPPPPPPAVDDGGSNRDDVVRGKSDGGIGDDDEKRDVK